MSNKRTRGTLDFMGWIHNDIPLGICEHCDHRIYRDEPHHREGYTDSSGNNDSKFFHNHCPNHTLRKESIIVKSRCQDCGVYINKTISLKINGLD